MTEQIDATNTTEHMADAESTAESAKAAVRGVEETHPEYVDFAVDDFPGGLPACLEAILMVADQPQTATELARILAGHPAMRLTAATSRQEAGRRLGLICTRLRRMAAATRSTASS